MPNYGASAAGENAEPQAPHLGGPGLGSQSGSAGQACSQGHGARASQLQPRCPLFVCKLSGAGGVHSVQSLPTQGLVSVSPGHSDQFCPGLQGRGHQKAMAPASPQGPHTPPGVQGLPRRVSLPAAFRVSLKPCKAGVNITPFYSLFTKTDRSEPDVKPWVC